MGGICNSTPDCAQSVSQVQEEAKLDSNYCGDDDETSNNAIISPAPNEATPEKPAHHPSGIESVASTPSGAEGEENEEEICREADESIRNFIESTEALSETTTKDILKGRRISR